MGQAGLEGCIPQMLTSASISMCPMFRSDIHDGFKPRRGGNKKLQLAGRLWSCLVLSGLYMGKNSEKASRPTA